MEKIRAKKKQHQDLTYEDLSKLIIEAVEQENFFTKDVLVPKVKAILRGFRVNLNSSKYKEIDSPSESQKRIRALEKVDHEMKFWRELVRNLDKDNIDSHYSNCDKMCKEYGF